MSLKNVLRLAEVYSRASRLITKKNFRMFRENRTETYLIYLGAVAIGILCGAGAGLFYMAIPSAAYQESFRGAITGFFIGLPTMCILFTLFLTMMFQLQRSGAKASVQPIYWFPVTWGEHTAASVLSGTLTGSLWAALLLCSAVLTASVFTGLLSMALLTSVCIFLCVALGGLTIEVFAALQTSLSGAIMKAAGRSAVWVRFFGVILLITVTYAAYFAFTQSSMTVVFKAIGDGQLSLWFIPYVWPGISLYAFSQGSWLEAVLFFAGAVVFAAIIFMAAVRLNARYRLSDTATIRISSAYVPKAGLLGRMGLPALESSIVKKDFRAFTRRTELMYVFVMPIMLLMATFMPLLMGNRRSGMDDLSGLSTFYYPYLVLLPSAALAMMFGMSVVGSEGERFWFITSSPVSPRNLVRAKLVFPAVICTIVVLICGIGGILVFGPSPRTAATGIIEALLVSYTVLPVALSCGIRGADFREVPRLRMIRTEWSLASMAISSITGMLVVLPVIAYAIPAFVSSITGMSGINGTYLYVAWLISAAISLAIGLISYKIAISNAGKLMEAA